MTNKNQSFVHVKLSSEERLLRRFRSIASLDNSDLTKAMKERLPALNFFKKGLEQRLANNDVKKSLDAFSNFEASLFNDVQKSGEYLTKEKIAEIKNKVALASEQLPKDVKWVLNAKKNIKAFTSDFKNIELQTKNNLQNGLLPFSEIHGFKIKEVECCIPTKEEREKERNYFDDPNNVRFRDKFVKHIAEHCSDALLKLGLKEKEIEKMKKFGIAPKRFNVHHKQPLALGGKNEFSNLILIPLKPHRDLHALVIDQQVKDFKTGTKIKLKLPLTDDMVYTPPVNENKKEKEKVATFKKMLTASQIR